MSSDRSVTSPVSARAGRSAPTTKVDAGSRARASRINGARSRGPRTAAGEAKSARNALKHGLCAHRFLVLPEEDAREFKALETALLADLAPVGTLQGVLAQRVVSAAWRLARADRMEAEVFQRRRMGDANLGLALIRDGNNTRSIETLMRYRAAAETQLQRALATLQALQAKAAAAPPARRRGPRPGAPRNEPRKSCQNNELPRELAAAPPPNAPARKRTAAVPSPLPAATCATAPMRHPDATPRPANAPPRAPSRPAGNQVVHTCRAGDVIAAGR